MAGNSCSIREWARRAAARPARARRGGCRIVTSYCPDGIAATALVLDSRVPVRCFYDLDTPVTLARIEAGEQTGYIGPRRARRVRPRAELHGRRRARRASAAARSTARGAALRLGRSGGAPSRAAATRTTRAALSYLGTYAEDRQAALERLFVEPARRRPRDRFVIGGAQYPAAFPWTPNICFVRHLPPAEHPAFYSSSQVTLNVTRAAMARWAGARRAGCSRRPPAARRS